jgi:hypothetical protein
MNSPVSPALPVTLVHVLVSVPTSVIKPHFVGELFPDEMATATL